MISAYVSGLGVGASLIIAIGAQNAFVLVQAIRKERHYVVAAICALIDALLIGAGVFGVGTLVASRLSLRIAAGVGGALFLLWFGYSSLRAAFASQSMHIAEEGAPKTPLKTVVLRVLAVSLLNPHVYLDTVVMLGAISGNYAGSGRYFFGLGAVTASIVWFFSLAKGGTMLAPVFAKPRAWQVLNILVCAMVWLVASGLAYGVWQELAVIPSLSAVLAY